MLNLIIFELCKTLENNTTRKNESLVIMVAMICPFSNNEKQALLECENINTLANTIISLFDFEINQTSGYETIN